jgi:hypothetical protein
LAFVLAFALALAILFLSDAGDQCWSALQIKPGEVKRWRTINWLIQRGRQATFACLLNEWRL